MVPFNPPVVMAPVGDKLPFDESRMAGLMERMGVESKRLSPYHHVREGQPPVLVLHGKEDPTVRYFTAELFIEAMKKAGNRAELAGYEGEKHGFFNHGRGGNRMYIKTVRRMDEFLSSLGWLEGKPTIEE